MGTLSSLLHKGVLLPVGQESSPMFQTQLLPCFLQEAFLFVYKQANGGLPRWLLQ